MKQNFLCILLIFCCPGLHGQELQPEKELGNQLYFCNEPAIAINPLDKRFELIATNKAHLFRSKNSGKKFSHKVIKSTLGVYGDPVLQYSPEGICYFAHLSQDKSKKWPDSFDQIVVQDSRDNGKSWSDGTGIGKNGKMQDKPWINIDGSDKSPFRGAVYISWTQFDKYESKRLEDSSRILFSSSSDKGTTFTVPVVVSDESGDCMDGDSTLEGATSSTGPDGTVFIAWAGFEKIFFDKSKDGGKSFGKDKVIANCPGGWDLDVPGFFRTNSLPFLSSYRNGNLVVCSGYEDTGYNRIFITESNDQGETWSQKMPVNNRDSTHNFMPHAYLDQSTENYYIIYYRKKGIYVDVMLSYRLNGNKDFSHLRVNRYTFTEPGNLRFMGDYINVCAVGDMVACSWTEPKGISTVVKTRRIILK